MWNGSITLMHLIEEGKDPDGFLQVRNDSMGHVPAEFRDVTRNDQMLASQSGYEIDRNVEIMACNYNRETLLIDEKTGELYEIMRTFQPERSSRMILTCRRKEPGTVKGGPDGV